MIPEKLRVVAEKLLVKTATEISTSRVGKILFSCSVNGGPCADLPQIDPVTNALIEMHMRTGTTMSPAEALQSLVKKEAVEIKNGHARITEKQLFPDA